MTERPAPEADDAAAPAVAEASPPAEPEWWDDPALPWRHKPQRADFVCLSALSIVGIYGLVMLPLRPLLIGLAPHVLGSMGHRTGLVLVGAEAALGDRWWPLVLVLATLMAVKFDWIYWWAGRLWGRNVMDVWATNKSARTQRRWEKVWDAAHRYETLAIIVTFLPLPLPAGVIYAALGAAGTRLWKFITVGLLSSLASAVAYLALGHWLGEPAVAAMEVYGRYMWYIAIAMLVGMLGLWWFRGRTAARTR